MNDTNQPAMPGRNEHPEQRDALAEAEKAAAVPQEESYDERAEEDKVVEIGPITEDGDAIKGLDPKK